MTAKRALTLVFGLILASFVLPSKQTQLLQTPYPALGYTPGIQP